MKISLFLSSFLLISNLSLYAQTTLISDLETLPNQVQNASPGDKFIIKDGTYSFSDVLKIEGNGALNDSIYIQAENSGNVIIQGLLELSGDYLVLSGFKFIDPFQDVDSSKGHFINVDCIGLKNSRITNNHFYNNGRNKRKAVDVALQLQKGSNYNKVDHNYWDQPNAVCVYVVPPSIHNTISYNKFENIGGLGRRWNVVKINNNIGRSKHSAYTVVSNNLFINFKKNEAEVISLKCSNNFVVDNLFYNCQGAVNFRQGSSNSAIGNIFYKSYGVRIAGEDHLISDNYFFKSTEVPVRIMKGGGSMEDLPMYLPVSNLSILRNTIYNEQPCAIRVGNGGRRNTIAPDNLLIMTNQFYNKEGSESIDWALPSKIDAEKDHTATQVANSTQTYDPLKFDPKIVLDLIANKNLVITEELGLDFK